VLRATWAGYFPGVETPWDNASQHDDEPEPGRRMPPLRDVRLRFGVTFSRPDRANAFATRFRQLFPRSSSTVIGETAWLVFRCGALDAHEAALQAAAAVEGIARHRIVHDRPRATHLYDFQVRAPISTYELARAAADREDALRQAVMWGLIRHPLVERVAAAQIVGRRAVPERPATDEPAPVMAPVDRPVPVRSAA